MNKNLHSQLLNHHQVHPKEQGTDTVHMSECVIIPLSTLAKVEHDQLTLSYDKAGELQPEALA